MFLRWARDHKKHLIWSWHGILSENNRGFMNAQTMHWTRLKPDTLSALGEEQIDSGSLFLLVSPPLLQGHWATTITLKCGWFWQPLRLHSQVFLEMQYTRKFTALWLVTIATVMKICLWLCQRCPVPALERPSFLWAAKLFQFTSY